MGINHLHSPRRQKHHPVCLYPLGIRQVLSERGKRPSWNCWFVQFLSPWRFPPRTKLVPLNCNKGKFTYYYEARKFYPNIAKLLISETPGEW